jgi:hypothetical protein
MFSMSKQLSLLLIQMRGILMICVTIVLLAKTCYGKNINGIHMPENIRTTVTEGANRTFAKGFIKDQNHIENSASDHKIAGTNQSNKDEFVVEKRVRNNYEEEKGKVRVKVIKFII